MLFKGEVIPSNGSGRILITEIDENAKLLSCRLCMGATAFFYSWFEHSTNQTIEHRFKVPNTGSTSSGGWSQMKTTDSLDLYKLRSNAIEGVFTCFLTSTSDENTAHLGIYYPSKL